MKTRNQTWKPFSRLAASAAAVLLFASQAPALEVISPTGVDYINVSDSSRFAATWGASNLFNFDVGGMVVGDVLGTTGEYAKSGGGSAFVAFEVDAAYPVGSVFFAQRYGSTTGDNMQRMSVWASETTAFTAADPGTPPQAVISLLPNTGLPKWQEYYLTNSLSGKYFLLKLEQTTVTGNPGGSEMRLGLAPQVPVIAVQPVPQTVYSGNTAKFTASGAGQGTLSYKWQSSPVGAGTWTDVVNGGNISGATTDTLILANVAVGADRDYRMVVTSTHGVANSDPATLTVTTSGPAIVTDLPSATIAHPAGYTLSLSVTVDGSRPMNYVWKKEGVTLVNDSRISGANSNVLSIASAKASDAGTYQVSISNDYGSIDSVTATVTVYASLPVLDPSGASYANVIESSKFSDAYVAANLFKQNMTEVKPGATVSGSEFAKKGPGSAWVSFNVDASYTIGSVFFAQRNGSGTGDNMQRMSIWTSDTTPFAAADPGTAPVVSFALQPNSGAPVWREHFLPSNITGRYFLLKLDQTTVTGNPGGNEMRFGLASGEPAITVPPTDQAAYSGTTVEFSAIASGAAPMYYMWQASPPGASNYFTLIDGANVSGSRASTLTLRNIALADLDYRVIATNAFGAATSGPARLSVTTSAPQLVADVVPASLQQPLGFAFQLKVEATGSGPITYQWSKGGTALQDGGRINGAKSNVLTVANAQAGDEGGYQVTIKNSLGELPSSTANVTIMPAGFGLYDGTAWALNGGATVTDGTLSLTEAVNSQARTAWFRTPLPITAFLATFTYQNVSAGGGDGFGFIMQNAPQGLGALGHGGGGLGYYGISPSAAVVFNAYNSATYGGRGLQYEVGGLTPQFGGALWSSTAPVNVSSGNPLDVSIRYNGTMLTVTMTDTATFDTFTTNILADIPAAVRGMTAYVGFSGGTGGVNAQQNISNVTFTELQPLTIQRVANNLQLSWPVSSMALVLQYTTDITSGVWVNETATVTEVNGFKQVTITPDGAPRFYRLGKQ